MESLLTTNDVARLLGCTPAAVRKWRAQGRLPAVKLGRLVRYRGDDVQRVASKGL
jgi:excisionase family DNA binding protein